MNNIQPSTLERYEGYFLPVVTCSLLHPPVGMHIQELLMHMDMQAFSYEQQFVTLLCLS